MENKFIQPLLKAGLIDIGDKDERLEDIEKAIADLQNKLKDDFSLLPVYTLVALDPNILDTEPILTETEIVLTEHWKALRSRFPEVPVPVLRSVILHALYNAGIGDATIARIIYLTGSNFYPYAKLSREKETVRGILSELGDKAEEDAIEEWSLVDEEPNLKLSSLKITGLKFNEVTITDTDLQANLKKAAGRTAQGYDPYNHPDQWATHFSTNATLGIVNILKSSFNQMAASLSPTSIETPINKFLGEFKKSLDVTLTNSFNSIRSVERRSKLLWWKETLYSTSIKNSYRTLNVTVQPLMMAYDLFQQLPAVTPVSVDYLLRDTLLLVNSNADQQIEFSELLDQINTAENKSLLKEYFNDKKQPVGRICFTDFITMMIHDKASVSELKQYTGIAATEKIALTELAVTILHDFMAEHLIPKD